MSFYLFISLFIVAVLSVLFVWKYAKTVTKTEILLLDDYRNKPMTSWYKDHFGEYYSILTEEEIAQQYLKIIHDRDVDTRAIVVGYNLKEKYIKYVGSSDAEDVIFYDLRSEIGFVGSIAVIHNKNNKLFDYLHREKITAGELKLMDQQMKHDQEKENIYPDELYWFRNIDPKHYELLHEYTTNILKNRWDTIDNTYNESVENQTRDSFFGIFNNTPSNVDGLRRFASDEISNAEMMEDGLNTRGIKHENGGYYINLFCDKLEFDEFISRLKSSVNGVLSTPQVTY